MTNKEQILLLRSQGMKYRQIATIVGVSYQRVAQVCAKTCMAKFRPLSETDCIYAGLRTWINVQKCTRNDLMRRLGFEIGGQTSARLRNILNGKSMPSKNLIDKFIDLTGMPYEQLFYKGVNQ